MKGTKQEKGITLIALIITIVLLIILAVVAINSIANTDLIAHVESSTGTYNNSVKNESDIIAEYLQYLENATKCEHTFGDYVTVTQMSCEGEGINGVKERTCTKCGTKETQETPWSHTLGEDGICTICNVCTHTGGEIVYSTYTYVDEKTCIGEGICNVCWKVAEQDEKEHSYYYGECEYCINPCPHDWVDGVCSVCKMECDHTSYINSKCVVCQWTHTPHDYNSEGYCKVCGAECLHEHQGWYESESSPSASCFYCLDCGKYGL